MPGDNVNPKSKCKRPLPQPSVVKSEDGVAKQVVNEEAPAPSAMRPLTQPAVKAEDVVVKPIVKEEASACSATPPRSSSADRLPASDRSSAAAKFIARDPDMAEKLVWKPMQKSFFLPVLLPIRKFYRWLPR